MGRRISARKNLAWTVLIALCLGSTLAVGQNGATSGTPNAQVSQNEAARLPMKAEDIPAIVAINVEAKMKALRDNTQLHAAGNLIKTFFLVTLLTWTSVKSMAGGKGLGELVGEWIPIFIAFGIVTVFLDRTAGDLIVTTMDQIAGAVGGHDTSGLESALKAGTAQIFKAISSVLMQPSVSDISNSSGGVVDRLTHALIAGIALLVGAVARIATAFCLVLAGVAMVSNIIMGYVSVQLVLALAPIMVPFLMFKPLEWLFNGWLKFLLSACMLKVVLAFLLTIAATLLTTTEELAAAAVQQGKGVSGLEAFLTDMLLLGVMLIFAVVATLLVMQAPRIADGLLAGSASGAGFSGIKGITQSAGARVAVSLGSRAGATAAQGLRNISSTNAGASDARAGRPKSLAYRDPRAKAAYETAYRDNS